jgi:hypothetical protein
LSGTDAVMPAGAAIPSLRDSGVPFPHPPSRNGETLGLVRAAVALSSRSFLKVLLCMWRSRVIEAYETSPEGAAVVVHLRLVDLLVSVFISLFFLLFYSLGLIVLRPQQVCLYRVVAI